MKYPIVVLTLLLLTASASNPVSADTRISFLSDRDPPVFSTFVMNFDGSNPINLSKKLGLECEKPFAISPDGTKVLFYSRRTGDFELFVMNADSSNLVNLTNLPGGDSGPVWSPDGTKILWERDSNIFVMNADGSEKRDLGPGRFPQWSPGGTRIGVNGEGWKSWIMKADGTDWHELSEFLRPQRGAEIEFLCWSPDGTKFVFCADYDWPARAHLYAVNVDGSGLVEIAKDMNGKKYRHASWSPDGTKIAFHFRDIFVVNIDGTDLVNLTGHHIFRGSFPKWSPDGEKILYDAYEIGEIYIMNADGSNPVNLTNHPAIDFHGQWFDAPPTSISPQDKLVTPWGKIKNGNQ